MECKELWADAADRAVEDPDCLPIQVNAIRWRVKEYAVVFLGPRWHDWACSCPAGAHPVCKHRAMVAAIVCLAEAGDGLAIYPWEEEVDWMQHPAYSRREGIPVR